MKKIMRLRHEFVEYIPNKLLEGTIYISITYATAVHKCCCGCGSEVVTPLSPTDWSLIFDGVTISLDPSIGNWNFDCQSHYWIKRNKINWARPWSRDKINAERAYDFTAKKRYFQSIMASAPHDTVAEIGASEEQDNFWKKMVKRLFKKL